MDTLAEPHDTMGFKLAESMKQVQRRKNYRQQYCHIIRLPPSKGERARTLVEGAQKLRKQRKKA